MRFIRKTRYMQDINLIKHPGHLFWYSLLLIVLFVSPYGMDRFLLGEFSLVFIYAIAGLGLMLLVGYTGLVSLGHAAFLAIGAYTHAYLLHQGLSFFVSLTAASVFSGVLGGLIGIPALRMMGIYLAVATLAFSIIVEQVLVHWVSVTGGFQGLSVPKPIVGGHDLSSPYAFYFLCLVILVICFLLAMNLLRSPAGRAMTAVRDSETSAESMGIDLAKTKTLAFALSAALTGLAGALFAHRLTYLAPDAFTIITSIQLLLMVVVGGLGSLHGVIYGAFFIGFFPQVIAIFRDFVPPGIAQIPGLEPAIFGLVLIFFLIYEPLGIYGRWIKIRLYFEEFPLYRKATYKRQKSFLRTERLH